MDAKATHSGAKCTARKARLLRGLILGKPAAHAIALLSAEAEDAEPQKRPPQPRIHHHRPLRLLVEWPTAEADAKRTDCRMRRRQHGKEPQNSCIY